MRQLYIAAGGFYYLGMVSFLATIVYSASRPHLPFMVVSSILMALGPEPVATFAVAFGLAAWVGHAITFGVGDWVRR